MLGILSVILIHSAPFDEVAQGTTVPKKDTEFSLKGGKTIVVSDIQFSGNNAIPTKQLEDLTNFYLNKPIAAADLSAMQQKIVSLYKSKGYNQAKVIIPSKQTGGVLTVIIQEGRIMSSKKPPK